MRLRHNGMKDACKTPPSLPRSVNQIGWLKLNAFSPFSPPPSRAVPPEAARPTKERRRTFCFAAVSSCSISFTDRGKLGGVDP